MEHQPQSHLSNIFQGHQKMMLWQLQHQQQEQQHHHQMTILEQQKQKLHMMLAAVTNNKKLNDWSSQSMLTTPEQDHTAIFFQHDQGLQADILRSSTKGLEKLRTTSTGGDCTTTSDLDPQEASDVSSSISSGIPPVYTLRQAGRWQDRFNELSEFKEEYGHCCVPSYWPQNAPLAQWVKRQRSQWRLKHEGKHSNLTNERELSLTNLGFVWDSHSVFWEERLNELKDFVRTTGHANVPTKYPENQQLAVWCKCQRRQFKLFTQGDRRSNITVERITKLANLGFDFDPRKKKTESTQVF